MRIGRPAIGPYLGAEAYALLLLLGLGVAGWVQDLDVGEVEEQFVFALVRLDVIGVEAPDYEPLAYGADAHVAGEGAHP